jgi:hypothetical protein
MNASISRVSFSDCGVSSAATLCLAALTLRRRGVFLFARWLIFLVLAMMAIPGASSPANHQTTRKGRLPVTVKILRTKRIEGGWVQKQVLRLEWSDKNGLKRHAAQFTPKPHWCLEEEKDGYLAEKWQADGTHLMRLLLYASDSGTSEYRTLQFFHMTANRCVPINTDLDLYSFSIRGSFYLHGKRLYIWDAIHEGDDSQVRHRYELRTFAWRQGRYHLTNRRSTRHAYQPFVSGAGIGENLNSKEDPLREFGMRWQWGMLHNDMP